MIKIESRELTKFQIKLKNIDYIQDPNLSSQWKIEGLSFGDINLIVGKNASGKSRILQAVNHLALLISTSDYLQKEYLQTDSQIRKWQVVFEDQETHQEKTYTLTIDQGKVTEEKLETPDKTYLHRDASGQGQIWAEELQQEMRFQTPTNEVAAIKRRDSIQHPFLEELYQWASSSKYYQFGTRFGQNSFANFSQDIDLEKLINRIDFRDQNFVIGIFTIGQNKFGSKFTDLILEDMEKIGYVLSEINTLKAHFKIPVKDLHNLYVQEKELSQITQQSEMSQGMFRALSLIIQLNYSLLADSSRKFTL